MDVKRRVTRRAAAAPPSVWRAAFWAAGVTLTVGILAAAIMRAVDGENFPTFARALWWSAQTVTTVGYGDAVPDTAAGKCVAVIVMITGIGFLTVFTASIASLFIQKATRAAEADQREALAEHLRELEAKIDRIEAAVRPTRSDGRA
jgi:voltage-gated potassium channel